jgi:hypothetical protein
VLRMQETQETRQRKEETVRPSSGQCRSPREFEVQLLSPPPRPHDQHGCSIDPACHHQDHLHRHDPGQHSSSAQERLATDQNKDPPSHSTRCQQRPRTGQAGHRSTTTLERSEGESTASVRSFVVY